MCNGNVIKVNKCGATTTTARKKKIKSLDFNIVGSFPKL